MLLEYDQDMPLYDGEYEYDEFLGRWVKRQVDKRANNPKVIERKKRRADRKADRQRDRPKRTPKHFERRIPKEPKERLIEEAKELESDSKTVKRLTRKEAREHKNLNKAIQEEYKTKQEELKAEELEKKVKLEEAKTDNLKGKTRLSSTGQGLIWIAALVGVAFTVNYFIKNNAPSANGVATK